MLCRICTGERRFIGWRLGTQSSKISRSGFGFDFEPFVFLS